MSVNKDSAVKLYEKLKELGLVVFDQWLYASEVRVEIAGCIYCLFQAGKWTFCPNAAYRWQVSNIPAESTDLEEIYTWALDQLSNVPNSTVGTYLYRTYKPRVVYPAYEQQELCL